MPIKRIIAFTILSSLLLTQLQTRAEALNVHPPVGNSGMEILQLTQRTLELVARAKSQPEFADQLADLEAQIDNDPRKADRLRDHLRQLRRDILFAHPLLDFDTLLVNLRPVARASHMCDQYLGRHSAQGDGLALVNNWKQNPTPKLLTKDKLPPGSVAFRAPAGVPLQLQAVDENGMAVMTMRSLVFLQPGEIAGWLDLNAQYYGDYSWNRIENRCISPEGDRALRTCIKERFGPELASQPIDALINVAQPDQSRILNAPLPQNAGGWEQITTNPFKSKKDPAYKKMRQLIEAAIQPLQYHDLAGTCNKQNCQCQACWVRKLNQTKKITQNAN